MNKTMLSLQQLGLRYGQLQALQGITLDVMAGERLAIIGPNGAGKSSLFDVISGFVRPSAGEIILDGKRLDHLSVPERARAGLMRSFQRSRLFKDMTVLEHLRCAASIHSLSALQRYAFWQSLKGSVPREEHLQHMAQALSLPLHRQATELSYSHQRLLELAMMLVADAKVLLLDEPAAGLDQAEVELFLKLLDTHAKDKTILFIEHDMDVVQQFAHRVAVLWDGKILAAEPWDVLIHHPDVNALWPLGAFKMQEGG